MKSRPPPPAPKPRKFASAANTSTESKATDSGKTNTTPITVSKSANNSPARLGLTICYYIVYYSCCCFFCNCLAITCWFFANHTVAIMLLVNAVSESLTTCGTVLMFTAQSPSNRGAAGEQSRLFIAQFLVVMLICFQQENWANCYIGLTERLQCMDAWQYSHIFAFCHAMLCISAAYAVMQCLSVCVCVCLSRLWIMSKRVNISSEFFLPSGSHTILVFPYQTGWWYSDGNPPNGGVECRWGRQKSQFWAYIWL